MPRNLDLECWSARRTVQLISSNVNLLETNPVGPADTRLPRGRSRSTRALRKTMWVSESSPIDLDSHGFYVRALFR